MPGILQPMFDLFPGRQIAAQLLRRLPSLRPRNQNPLKAD